MTEIWPEASGHASEPAAELSPEQKLAKFGMEDLASVKVGGKNFKDCEPAIQQLNGLMELADRAHDPDATPTEREQHLLELEESVGVFRAMFTYAHLPKD